MNDNYSNQKQFDDYPNFSIQLIDERKKLDLSLASMRRPRQQREVAAMSNMDKNSKNEEIVTFCEEDIEKFKENMVAKNTKKSANVAVRRLKAWYA